MEWVCTAYIISCGQDFGWDFGGSMVFLELFHVVFISGKLGLVKIGSTRLET